MKLAVIGNTNKATQQVIKHGHKVGYKIITPLPTKNDSFLPTVMSDGRISRILEQSDAVLCLLTDESRSLNNKVVEHLVSAMHSNNVKRLVLLAPHEPVAKNIHKSLYSRLLNFLKREENQAKSILGILESSHLDWTLIGCQEPWNSKTSVNLAKYMINQLTDVANLRRVSSLPGNSIELA